LGGVEDEEDEQRALKPLFMAVGKVSFVYFLQYTRKGDKMGKKILTMSLVLVMVMVLSLTTCGEEAKEEVELTAAQEIIDGVIESFDNIRTYQFDMDMTIDMAGKAEGEALEMTVTMDNSGTLDLENVQMRADLTTNMVAPGEDEMEMVMEIYLIGDLMYAMMKAPEMDKIWVKSEIPEGRWEQMSQTESQIELLKTAQVKVIGSEKVNGVDCYVLQLTPDMEQIWRMAMQQADVTGGEMPDVAEELIREMVRSFSVKQWVAKDTYFLTKAEIDMAMELTPEAMGLSGEGGEVSMNITFDFLAYNYNQPVSISLPPEAEEAIEVPIE